MALLNPEKQRLIEKQLLAENRKHPNQNVEAILARSEGRWARALRPQQLGKSGALWRAGGGEMCQSLIGLNLS